MCEYSQIKYKPSFSQSLVQMIDEEIAKNDELEDIEISNQYGLTICFVGHNKILNERTIMRFTNITMYNEQSMQGPKQIFKDLEKINHPRILKIKQYQMIKKYNNSQYSLCFEKLEYFDKKQSLREFLNEKTINKQFPINMQFSIILQVFDAVAALHAANLSFGNIMPNNFSFSENEIKFTNYDVFKLNQQPLDLELLYYKSPEQRNKDIGENYKIFSSDNVNQGETYKYHNQQSDSYLLGLIILDVIAFNSFNPKERIKNMAFIQDSNNINPYNFPVQNTFLLEKAKILLNPQSHLRGNIITHLRDLVEEEKSLSRGNFQTLISSLKLSEVPDKKIFEKSWFQFLITHLEEQNDLKNLVILSQEPYMIKFRGIEIQTGRIFCLHIENISSLNNNQLEYTNKQQKLIEKLNHPKIVKYCYSKPVKASQRDAFYYFIKSKTEYYSQEYTLNLKDYLEKFKVSMTSIHKQIQYKLIIQLLDAISSAHQDGIQVIDISPKTIFLKNTDIKVCIGGYNSIIYIYDKNIENMDQQKNSIPYISPEVHKKFYGLSKQKISSQYAQKNKLDQNAKLNLQSDIYSIGVVILEILFCKVLQRVNLLQIVEDVQQQKMQISSDIDPFLFQKAQKMVSINPDDRGKIVEYLLEISQKEKKTFPNSITDIFQQNIKESLETLVVKSTQDLIENFFKFKKIQITLGQQPFSSSTDYQELFEVLIKQYDYDALFFNQGFYVSPWGINCYEKNKVQKEILQQICIILNQNQLQEFCLEANDSQIYLEEFQHFTKLLKNQDNLKKLTLGLESNQLCLQGQQNARSFSKIFKRSNMKYINLNLSNNKIHEEGFFEIMANLAKNKQLEYLKLNIRSNQLSIVGCEDLLQKIQQLNKLSVLHLNLGNNRIGNKGFINISNCMTALENLLEFSLILCDNSLDQGFGYVLNSFTTLSKLKQLTLWASNCNIQEKIFEFMTKSFSSFYSTLKHLSLNFRSNNIGIKGCQFLNNEISQLNSLNYLYLNLGNIEISYGGQKQLGQNGFKLISDLLAGLTVNQIVLKLDGNNIDDEIFDMMTKSLKKVKRLKNLELTLQNNPISDSLIQDFRQSLDQSQVKNNL
ncbi:protein kinase (macronuclear) [Tetrahymena thermophila SB210]|uniref:Protein kinase n=1 Tax=Tetrahymena thermophila (strain SB210) TaxID=312017 RepID=Q233X3_TETTS|nr:protein kinase [Tetrahymena thermophila SB210]EAR91811.2 protein kinase [Tetrahymena thermophila SB210]|eukprot:XP_001012056.2 protein kinase [Tetrahymena thermophila SB210]